MSKTGCSILSFASRCYWRRAAAALLAVSLLSACGYRLSGDNADQVRQFDPVLKTVSLQGLKRYGPLRRHIKEHLQSYGMRIRSPQNASARIVITKNSARQKDLVIGDYAKTREKLLILTIAFHVEDSGSGRYLLPAQTIRVEDTYLYDSLDPPRNANERKQLIKFLYQKVSEQMVFRLATIRNKRKEQIHE